MSFVRFGVRNPVPVNLLMVILLLGGVFAALNLRRQFFPDMTTRTVTIPVVYPGASPDQVVDAAMLRIEDALSSINGIEEVNVTAAENGGGVTIKLEEGSNVADGLEDIQQALDGIQGIPADVESLEASLLDPKMPAIRVMIYGANVDAFTLQSAREKVRQDLLTLPGMGQVIEDAPRDREIEIACDPSALRNHGMTAQQVALAIQQWLVDMPSGTLESQGSRVRLRVSGAEENISTLAQLTLPGAQSVRLCDVATLKMGYQNENMSQRFNGQPADSLTIYRVGEQDFVAMAQLARAYALGRQGEALSLTIKERLQILMSGKKKDDSDMPASLTARQQAWQLGQDSFATSEPIKVAVVSDLARFVEGRLELLSRNASYGIMLVFATLLIFLNIRSAVWVGVGLAAALGGTLLIMWGFGITLNLLTMFGLIIVIGLLVDDAIVVSENIQAHHDDKSESPDVAAIKGGQQVAWPVCATIATSIVAFLPLMFIKGEIGDLLGALPWVVGIALIVSLVESLLILPGHMAHSLAREDKKVAAGRVGPILRVERAYGKWRDGILKERIIPAFGQFLKLCVRFRYITIAVSLVGVMVSLAMVKGRHVGFEFLPNEDSETVLVDVRMPVGTPVERTSDVIHLIETTCASQEGIATTTALIGTGVNIETSQSTGSSEHVGQVFLELDPVEKRTRHSRDIIEDIRSSLQQVDPLVLQRIRFSPIGAGPSGPDITYQLTADSVDELNQAAQNIKAVLWSTEGVFDVSDSAGLGQGELQIAFDEGNVQRLGGLGFWRQEMQSLARGIEAWRTTDGSDEIEVRIRQGEYDEVGQLANAWFSTPVGMVPILEVADLNYVSGYASLRRLNAKPMIQVTANVSEGFKASQIVADLANVKEQGSVFQLMQKYPSVEFLGAGKQKQQRDSMASLPFGLLTAIILIYVILAWLFGSYTQPVVVMSVIPFAVIGVVWGHFILGFNITILSLIGFIALSGIVVNDSLILIEFYNSRRARGEDVLSAAVAAGKARLRAIFLTTATTFLGLMPMMLEKSYQARFLIPMAISIAMGLLAATFCVLCILPSLLVVYEDLRILLRWAWVGRADDENTT